MGPDSKVYLTWVPLGVPGMVGGVGCLSVSKRGCHWVLLNGRRWGGLPCRGGGRRAEGIDTNVTQQAAYRTDNIMHTQHND